MRSRWELPSAALILVLAAPLYFAAHQLRKSLRFEIGSMDRDYLASEEQFYPRARMSGPLRHPDNRVEVIDFYGRLTRRRAVLRLPYHALRSPLRIRIRCHRFGLGGTVALAANGERIREFLFTERSYPWGGIEAVIPQEVAQRGPLNLELLTYDAGLSAAHLPEDLGVGLDWIEVKPLSRGAILLAGAGWWALALAFPILGYLFMREAGASSSVSIVFLASIVAAISLLTAAFPLPTGMALRRLWVVFPLGILLRRGLAYGFSGRLCPQLERGEIDFLSRLFVAAVLAHSVLIFPPNHAPPDLWNHLPQIDWLHSLELSYQNVLRYSSSYDSFEDGHIRPRFGAPYGAPYPPFFYLLTYAASRLHDDDRFLLEFIPVLFGALMLILVFLIAKAVWPHGLAARLAAVLLSLEISLWHHVHRAHAPGIFGEFFVLLSLMFLSAYGRSLATGRGVALFAAISCLTVLSYTAPLVQISILIAMLGLLLAIFGGREDRVLIKGLIAAFGLGLGAAFAVYYWHYAVEALAKSGLLLDRGSYDPPASFFVLRNQMRDTVRILTNGYPLYVVFSAAGLAVLRRTDASRFHHLLLWAGVLTYLSILALKDPLLLPRVFLHAKEDLFYAPIACLLSATALARLWNRSGGRRLVIAILLALSGLAIRDQVLNVDTLSDQPATPVIVIQGAGPPIPLPQSETGRDG